MSIHIIIDGYNLIRQSSSLSPLDRRDLQLGREALVDLLVTYKRIKHHKITVVFDGTNAASSSGHKDYIGGIEIKFSRSGESADSVIKNMAAGEKEKALVVSSDRDVVDSAYLSGAAVISSIEFEKRLEMAAHLDGFSVDDTDEVGWIPTTKKKGPSRKLPKRKRRSAAKIKKL
ncbi:MAG: NYN domain-containing protein [Thermodesulfobacteriota bacterium]|nr:NYN domain-containing protein [Thermodesulfobacteriota bacterium]